MDYPELLKGYKNEMIKLQEILLKERENRETDEQYAVELLTKVKETYDLRFKEIKSDYEDKIKQLESQIFELNEQKDKLVGQKDKLIEQKSNLNQQNDELIEQKNDLDKQKENLNKQKENLNKQKENLNKQKDDLNRQKDDLSKQKDEIINQKNELNQQKKELNQQKKELIEQKKELNQQKDEINQQKNEIHKQKNELNKLKNELNEQKNELNQQKNELNQQKNELNLQKNGLNTQLKDEKLFKQKLLESENKQRSVNLKLKSIIDSLESQNEKLESTLDEELIEKKKIILENNEHLKTINNLNNELQRCREKIDLLNQQLEILRKKVNQKDESLEKDVKAHLERINDLKNKLEIEIQNNENYTKEIIELQQSCFEKDLQIRQFENRIEELVKELNLIKEENSNNLTDAENLKKQNYSLAKMYDDIMQKYTSAKNRISTLHEENDLKKLNYDCEKLKFEVTIAQQIKLINHLYDQIEEVSNKKSWFGMASDCRAPKSSALFKSSPNKKMNLDEELYSLLEREKRKNEILKKKIDDLERIQNKRKNDHIDNNKKLIKNETATAPSFTEDDSIDFKSCKIDKASTNQPEQNIKNSKKVSFVEEEFTFTDSIMDELAYQDD